ncbi:hypothetical protein Gohar_017511 [Gossypium harknessii]|uniref:Reverse transcriptase zinc-binding domain-containing protein n=1 Tax=Gossypium harknessii TaxID=34285 RepID=A0A7J9G635_9ROSI|nr:hypothetical protein [Gossypium harknessii]
MDELALVDIKPDKGWFTWVNNRGRKPKMQYKDPRLSFKFDECWTTNVEAKNIIKGAWHYSEKNFVEKLDNMCLMLGPWQRGKYNKMEKDIRRLEHKIDMVIDIPQGLEGLNREVIKSNMLSHNEYNVRELWHVESRSWNTYRVCEFYGQEKICNLPIEDKNHNNRMQIGFGPHRFFWRAIWKLDTLPKIRVFTWHVDNEILPTNVKIASVRRGFGQACPRCGADYETLVHTLKDYPISRATLMFGGLDSSIIFKEYDRCINWLEDMLRILDKK